MSRQRRPKRQTPTPLRGTFGRYNVQNTQQALPDDTVVFVLQLNNTTPAHTEASRAALEYYAELMEEANPAFAKRLRQILVDLGVQTPMNRAYRTVMGKHSIPEPVHELLKLHSGYSSSKLWPSKMTQQVLDGIEQGITSDDESAYSLWNYELGCAYDRYSSTDAQHHLERYCKSQKGSMSAWFLLLCWLGIEQMRIEEKLLYKLTEKSGQSRELLWDLFKQEVPRLERTTQAFVEFAKRLLDSQGGAA